MAQLAFEQVLPTDVVLETPALRYQDDLPLSDIVVAQNGALCCARRVPNFAEVLAWPEGLAASPVSWTGPPSLPILCIFAFDGSVAYAHTHDQLLRIRPGVVDVLHHASKPIRNAHLSPDGEHILWLETAGKARGYVAPARVGLKPLPIRINDYCYDARWLSSDEILALELHHVADAEAGQSLHLLSLQGEVESTAFHTEDFALRLGPVSPHARRVILFGHALRHDHSQPPQRSAVWAFDIEADSFHCLGNATPGGGTAVLVAEGCLFADAARQTAESSRLLFVSEAGCRVAGVGAFLREFALAADGSTILLRTFGRRPGIAELPIDGLTTAR